MSSPDLLNLSTLTFRLVVVVLLYLIYRQLGRK